MIAYSAAISACGNSKQWILALALLRESQSLAVELILGFAMNTSSEDAFGVCVCDLDSGVSPLPNQFWNPLLVAFINFALLYRVYIYIEYILCCCSFVLFFCLGEKFQELIQYPLVTFV